MKTSRIQDLDVLRGKVPPQNLEAEVAVLGAILIDGQAIGDAVELLTADYFYKDAHRKIFTAIINLFNENKAIDLITLTENLNQTGAIEEVGGPDYLAFLTTARARPPHPSLPVSPLLQKSATQIRRAGCSGRHSAKLAFLPANSGVCFQTAW